MNKCAAMVIGIIVALNLAFWAAAFVAADVGWVNGVMKWERSDRMILVLVFGCLASLGGLIGSCNAPPRR